MRVVAVAVALLVVVGLIACQDHYRYPCQNPDNFGLPECQKPKCLFTQQCPEYLVAPILEKQVNAQAAQPNAAASEPKADR